MTHEDGTSLYESAPGTLIVRVSDGAVLGDVMDLGRDDSPDNYEEREFTAEEIAAFEERAGIRRGKIANREVNHDA